MPSFFRKIVFTGGRTALARRIIDICVVGLAAIFIFAQTSSGKTQDSLDAVLKDCEKKTIVMGRDEKGSIVRVGEKLSGYCKGFLEGAFAVLVQTRTICVNEKTTNSEFLLSTVLTYRAETKSRDNDAATVIEAAFKRAFNCTPEQRKQQADDLRRKYGLD